MGGREGRWGRERKKRVEKVRWDWMGKVGLGVTLRCEGIKNTSITVQINYILTTSKKNKYIAVVNY